jgi:hypothetical protein
MKAAPVTEAYTSWSRLAQVEKATFTHTHEHWGGGGGGAVSKTFSRLLGQLFAYIQLQWTPLDRGR